jgi:hypothetical protein
VSAAYLILWSSLLITKTKPILYSSFFNDVIQFVKPYVRVMPPVFEKYMGTHEFKELLRSEVVALKRIWAKNVSKALSIANPNHYVEGAVGVTKDAVAAAGLSDAVGIGAEDKALLVVMIKRCPYLAEPKIALACSLKQNETYEVRYVHVLLFSRFSQFVFASGLCP